MFHDNEMEYGQKKAFFCEIFHNNTINQQYKFQYYKRTKLINYKGF